MKKLLIFQPIPLKHLAKCLTINSITFLQRSSGTFSKCVITLADEFPDCPDMAFFIWKKVEGCRRSIKEQGACSV